MNASTRWTRLAFIVTTLAALGACEKTEPSRFYLLSPIVAPAPGGGRFVGQVDKLPAYIVVAPFDLVLEGSLGAYGRGATGSAFELDEEFVLDS